MSDDPAVENAEEALRTLYRRVVDVEQRSTELEAQLRVARMVRAELERRCDQLEDEVEHLRGAAAELAALEQTRVLRWTRLPRSLYRRVRRSQALGL